MSNFNTRALVTATMLVACEILLTRFFSISTPIVRIGFGFLPIAITAMLYGPIYAGIGAACGDFIGAMLFPTGPFFPGFTVTAFLTGVAYGLFLYNKPKTTVRVAFVCALVLLTLDLGLNTLWLQIITGKAYLALMPARITKTAIMLPVQIFFIRVFAAKWLLSRLGQEGSV